MPQSNEEGSFKLLCDIQQELANSLNSLGGQQSRGALDNYYFHAAKHLNRAAEGFIFLRNSARVDASKFLVRPVIEMMFRVEALRKKPELLYRIAYSESIVEDRKWIHPAAIRAGATFDEAAHSKRFEAFKAQLNEQFPTLALEDKYISVREIADVADMAGFYDSHYRTYCRYTHAALWAIGDFLAGLTDPEDNRTMGLCTYTAVNALTSIGAESPNLQSLWQRLQQQVAELSDTQ
jgi:Family of unknown function (DUF5677)